MVASLSVRLGCVRHTLTVWHISIYINDIVPFYRSGHLNFSYGCPIKTSLNALITLELDILLSLKDIILGIVCLIVIIVKIGQSAANQSMLTLTFLHAYLSGSSGSSGYSGSSVSSVSSVSSSSFSSFSDSDELSNAAEEEEGGEEIKEGEEEEEAVEIDTDMGRSETTRENEEKGDNKIEQLPLHRPHHRYPKNDEELGYYLAGLIDGDGYISSECSQPTITITFHKKDTFLASKIKSLNGYGSVRSYSNYSIYTITKKEGIIKMIDLIHNKLRLDHKVNRLNSLIDRYNLPLRHSIPDTSNVLLTHYLAGLLDLKGSLSIQVKDDFKERKDKGRCAAASLTFGWILERTKGSSGHCVGTRPEVRGTLHGGLPDVWLVRVELNYLTGLTILNQLNDNLGGSLCPYIREYEETKTLGARVSKSLSWNLVSLKRMYNLLVYLDRYNLSSSKYLEYLYLRKAYLLIQDNRHLTEGGQAKLSYFQKRMSELNRN